jgi:hypothetical protein
MHVKIYIHTYMNELDSLIHSVEMNLAEHGNYICIFIYMYMHIYIYLFICVYIHIYIFVYINIYISVEKNSAEHGNLFISMYMYIYKHV